MFHSQFELVWRLRHISKARREIYISEEGTKLSIRNDKKQKKLSYSLPTMTKILLFWFESNNPTLYSYRKHIHVKHGGGSIMLWESFSAAV